MFKDKCECHRHLFKILFSLTMFIFAVSAAFYVYFYSQSIQPDSYRSFSVSGEGKSVTVPDIAQFTFSVITEGGMKIVNTQRDNTNKINKVIDYLKSNDVDKKDIKTQGYSVEPRYRYFNCTAGGECPPPEIVGYTVNQSVVVKVRNLEKAGEFLSGVVDNGANSVSQLTFTIDDPTSVQNEARAEAIGKAQEKAKAIAKAGGFSLGKLLSIEEGISSPAFYGLESVKAYGIGGGGDVPTPAIEPGSEEVIINVILRYEIK